MEAAFHEITAFCQFTQHGSLTPSPRAGGAAPLESPTTDDGSTVQHMSSVRLGLRLHPATRLSNPRLDCLDSFVKRFLKIGQVVFLAMVVSYEFFRFLRPPFSGMCKTSLHDGQHVPGPALQ